MLSIAMLNDNGVAHFGITPLTTLPDGEAISVEFVDDKDAIEISLVVCGAVTGLVFVPVDRVSDLFKQFRSAVKKYGEAMVRAVTAGLQELQHLAGALLWK